MSQTPRWPGQRWSISYGSYESVEAYALRELQRVVQLAFPYVVRTLPRDSERPADDHLLVIGTPDGHPFIRDLVERRFVEVPREAGGYAIRSAASPWNPMCKLVAIAGRDAAGVLYGVQDFCARMHPFGLTQMSDPVRRRAAFDQLGDFDNHGDYPRIADRGLWTWGYVIYDYRGYLDAMARMRMNMLTIWNDVPPVNIGEVILYAHERGIRVVLGFSWGWGDCKPADLARPDFRARIKAEVVERYRREYRHLSLDGIYFQTVTEHSQQEVASRTMAAVACEFVNDVARALLEERADLSIQFGLHASSIKEHYKDLAALDPRVTIVWEDAGALPYEYTPKADPAGIAAALDYSRKLATFRPGTPFGLVPKGWFCLQWADEFEQHGPFVLGERHPWYIAERERLIRPRAECVDRLWLGLYPRAAHFYREMLALKPSSMLVTGLVEDACIETRIPLSVALFAQTIWNPCRSDDEILTQALSPHYQVW